MTTENQTELTELAWGSPELDEKSKTDDGAFFKLETGESAKIQVIKEHKPKHYLKDFGDGKEPTPRFDIIVKEKDERTGNYGPELVWSCSRTSMKQINFYIGQTDKFQIIKKERGFDVVPLGLPAD